jgi:hypothetical protein
MTLYELINPSDHYTFYAPSIEVAGTAVLLLSKGFGAAPVSGEGESSPILFGWEVWLDDKGIDRDWIKAHSVEIADALDSFLIGDAEARADWESMLEAQPFTVPPEKRAELRNQRQDRHRTSMNQIGESAYALAKQLRAKKDQEDSA